MNIPFSIADFMMQEALSKREKEELDVASIIKHRFKVDTDNIEEVKVLIKLKKLAIVYSYEGELLGVSSNNRWLYTVGGQIIGKVKGKFKIEDIRRVKGVQLGST